MMDGEGTHHHVMDGTHPIIISHLLYRPLTIKQRPPFKLHAPATFGKFLYQPILCICIIVRGYHMSWDLFVDGLMEIRNDDVLKDVYISCFDGFMVC